MLNMTACFIDILLLSIIIRTPSKSGMAAAYGYAENDIWRSILTMHILGHIEGLDNRVFLGIDSWERTAEEYKSAMNYNVSTRGHETDPSFVTFSDGNSGPNDFNDYAHLELERISRFLRMNTDFMSSQYRNAYKF